MQVFKMKELGRNVQRYDLEDVQKFYSINNKKMRSVQ